MARKPTVRTQIRLSVEMIKWLDAKAKDGLTDRSKLIRSYIDKAMDKERRKR